MGLVLQTDRQVFMGRGEGVVELKSI
jgi:hypothetical protein